jgi:hypothetical protein
MAVVERRRNIRATKRARMPPLCHPGIRIGAPVQGGACESPTRPWDPTHYRARRFFCHLVFGRLPSGLGRLERNSRPARQHTDHRTVGDCHAGHRAAAKRASHRAEDIALRHAAGRHRTAKASPILPAQRPGSFIYVGQLERASCLSYRELNN